MSGWSVYTVLASSTQQRLAVEANRQSLSYSQLSPKAKLCVHTPERQVVVVVFVFFSRSGGICQLCCFSALYPEGLAIECCFIRCRFCHQSPFSLGAFLRLPTNIENGCVHLYKFVWAHTYATAQHPHTAKHLFVSTYVFSVSVSN